MANKAAFSANFNSEISYLGVKSSSPIFTNYEPLRGIYLGLTVFYDKPFTLQMDLYSVYEPEFNRASIPYSANGKDGLLDISSKLEYSLIMIGTNYYPLWKSRAFVNPYLGFAAGVASAHTKIRGRSESYELSRRNNYRPGIIKYARAGEIRAGIDLNFNNLYMWDRESYFVLTFSMSYFQSSEIKVANFSTLNTSEEIHHLNFKSSNTDTVFNNFPVAGIERGAPKGIMFKVGVRIGFNE